MVHTAAAAGVITHHTYAPFLATHDPATGGDPWFVKLANELITMNRQNRHRILIIEEVVSYLLICLLLCMAGIASGLTLSLFTLDYDRLKSTAAHGLGRKAEQSRRILPYLANPHWTLVTLLLVNAVAAETLPLVLDRMFGGIIAVVLSVFLVLFFGEIFPQAFFTRYAMPICSYFAPLLGFMRMVTAPISFPVGKLLDFLVGHRKKNFMRRVELQQFIRLHQQTEKDKRHERRDAAIIEATVSAAVSPNPTEEGTKQRRVGKNNRKGVVPGPKPQSPFHRSQGSSDEDSDGSSSSDSERLEELEVRIMLGALSMSELRVKHIMKKKVENIFCVAADRKIDKEIVEKVFVSGYSRVPVIDEREKRFLGYFLSRDLVKFAYQSEDDAPTARKLHLHQPLYCSGEETVGSLYVTLCSVSTPLVIVTDGSREQKQGKDAPPIGLVTFEDVFETVQGATIADETDLENATSIQLKTRLQSAMAIRRENKRVAEALMKGMLTKELTSDFFLDHTHTVRNDTFASRIRGLNLVDINRDSLEPLSPLTSRTGLLHTNSNANFSMYGATTARKGLNTTFREDPSDTFLSQKIRNAPNTAHVRRTTSNSSDRQN